MEAMQEKLEELERGIENTPKISTKRAIEIPEECQTACRTIMKKMREVFDFERYQNNEMALNDIITEVKRLYKGKRWEDGVIIEACKKIWRNLRDQNTRSAGTYESHKENSGNKKRLITKLKRWQSALSELDAPEDEKREILKVLKIEYMSPEKSDEESEGKRRYRIPFSWESSLLTRRIEDLDETYERKLSPSAKRQIDRVYDIPDNSRTEGPPPRDTPSWAISRKYKEV